MTQPLLPPGETPRTTAVWRRAVTFDEMTEHARQLERELRQAQEDARRYRFIRNLLAIEDVERLIADGNPTPDEQESVRTDAAIDAAASGTKEG